MADFASIYGMANKPTSPAPDLANSMGTVASIQHLGQQNVLGQQQIQQGQMQNQQMQQQLQDATELRDTIKQAAAEGQSPVQAVAKLGSPSAQKWLQSYTEMAQNQTKLSKEQFDLAQAHLAKVGGDVITASQQPGVTPQQVAQVITNHIQQGNIPQAQGQQLIQSLPQDSTQLPAWGMAQGATMNASKELLGLFTPTVHMVDTGTATQPTAITAATGKVTPLGAPIDKDIGPGDLKKFASDIGALKDDGTVDMSNPLVKAKVHAMTTNMATVIQGGSGAGSGDLSKPLGDPGEEALAQAIARKEQPPLIPNMRTPGANRINGRAAAINSGVLPGSAEVSTQTAGQKSFAPGGVNGQTLINLDTAIHHFDALGQAVSALGNGDTQGMNKVGNYLSTQFGDPKVTNFETVKTLAADEFAKVAAGAQMGESDRHTMQNLFSSANSPQQLTQAIGKAQQLMGGKVQGLNQSYQQLYPGHNIGERVSPETNQVLQGMGIKFSAPPAAGTWQSQPANPNASQGGAGATPTAAPALQKLSPQDAAKLPAGTHFLGLDGVERVKH